MRSISVVIILVALFALAGCGKSEAPAADQGQPGAPAQSDQDAISKENFESGEVEGTIETVDEGEETETHEAGETP